MYSQFANSQLDETMDSNRTSKREVLPSRQNDIRVRSNDIRVRLNDLRSEAVQVEQMLRMLDNQQPNIIKQSNRPNQPLPLTAPHQSRGKICMSHGLKQQLICYYCQKSICLKCSKAKCQSHAVYSKQKGLQKFTIQLLSRQTPEVDRLIMLHEKSTAILSKKQKQLRQKVDNCFSLLEKQIQAQKIQIKKHFDQQIGRGIKQINSQIEKLRNLHLSLNKYKKKGMRTQTIEDLQFFEEDIKSSLKKIKQQSKEKVICERIQDMDLNESSIDKIRSLVRKIEYGLGTQKEDKLIEKDKSNMPIKALNAYLRQPTPVKIHKHVYKQYSCGYIKKQFQLIQQDQKDQQLIKNQESGSRVASRDNKRQTELAQCIKDFSNPKYFLKMLARQQSQGKHKEFSNSEKKMKEDDEPSKKSQGSMKGSKISYFQKREKEQGIAVVKSQEKADYSSNETKKPLDSLTSKAEFEQRRKWL